MTQREQLAAIRAACVTANPEIEQRRPQGFKDDPNRFPIRLADVLLALYERERGGGWKPQEAMTLLGRWNLRQDDLSKQSDECVAFLYDLLK